MQAGCFDSIVISEYDFHDLASIRSVVDQLIDFAYRERFMRTSTTPRDIDLVVCGSCTVDVLAGPIDLSIPIGVGQLHRVDPITLSVGGIVSNACITATRLGQRTAAFSRVGQDGWGNIVMDRYQAVGIDCGQLVRHDSMPTSTTVVMIDAQGQRSFVHSQGAPKAMTADDYFDAMPLFSRSRAMLLGYYPLLPNLLDQLQDVLAEIKNVGCCTALDAAGGGGTMEPLADLLPHLDVYFPSYDEATNQTGLESPSEILQFYRSCGATGVLGVKLGANGAVVSPMGNEFFAVDAPPAPSPVVDTTGAGDVFFAALLSGILKGKSVPVATRIAAKAASVSVTAAGATTASFQWNDVTQDE